MEVDEEEKKPSATTSTNSSNTPITTATASGTPSIATVVDDKKKTGATPTTEEKKDPEPSFEILNNPARVMRQQLKVITINEGAQYVPVKDVTIGGIIMVRNTRPGEEELVEPVAGNFKTNYKFIHMLI